MNLPYPKHSMTIGEFYKNKNVFITGATGFLGKVLIEKLLRSCPEIGNIYILIRPKKGKSIEERLEQYLEESIFDTLKTTNSSQLSKIIPISGDCQELKLDISEENYNTLTSKVNVIFHVAASVRFDDLLKKAILLNTRGTREACQLAIEAKNLSVFVYVSTSYCNCIWGETIEEKMYPIAYDWRKVIEIAEKFDENILPILGDKYLGPYPNTYTFTKALSEHVVSDLLKNRIPTVICRPSIVVSSLKEPVKGWIDNFNGPVGILVACGKGLTRTSYQLPDIYPDYIPVDCAIKSIIVASWDTALTKNTSIEIIHCCSGRPWLSLRDLPDKCKVITRDIPFDNSIWLPKGSPTTCKYYAYICFVFFHLLPAFFLDLGLQIAGRKKILTRLITKIYGAMLVLRYFTTQIWIFKNDKFYDQEKKILDEDRTTWSYDYNQEDIYQYLVNCIKGCRKYLLKEKDEDLPRAKRHYMRMYWLDKITMSILYGTLIWLLYSSRIHEILFNCVYNKTAYYFDGKEV